MNTNVIDRKILVVPKEIDATYAKVTWRLIPLLFICYVLNQMDRFNIGYAHLRMSPDLGFSDAVYGLGASMFYIGYVMFEVPSNLLLQKIGARKTILRIMFLWGLATAATAFVRSPAEFYVARFFLGVFEAGFLPGIVLYLTYWYPKDRRAKITALFMTAIVISGVVNGPLSGWILQNLNGAQNMRGWQWLFLIEGIPASIIGICVYFWLSDRPADAHWLTDAQREIVRIGVLDDVPVSPQRVLAEVPALRNPKVYVLSFVSFAMGCGAYTLAFWTPTIIKGLGIASTQRIGMFATLPFIAALVVMILLGKSSDRMNERRWHFSIASGVGAIALVLTTYTGGMFWLSIALLSVAAAGIIACYPLFWASATVHLTKSTSASGIAIINSLGALSGVTCPYFIGLIKTSTGSLSVGLYFIAAIVFLGAIAMIVLREPEKIR